MPPCPSSMTRCDEPAIWSSSDEGRTMSSQWSMSSLEKRSRNSLWLTVDGETQVPFTVLVGEEHAPALLIIAGVHGDEYEGPAAIYEAVEELKPEFLQGSIIFVPVANPAAFAAATRCHPFDGGDLNRSFPGDPDGSATSRLAHVLFQELALHSNYILSLHGWSKECMVLPYVEYPQGRGEAELVSQQAARASGFEWVYPYQWSDGLLCAAALRHGIPAIEAEIGGLGGISPAGQALCHAVILRFLAHFGIIDTAPAVEKPARTIGHSDLRAAQAGLLRSHVQLGDPVRVGDPLASIRGMDGRVGETVYATRDSIVGLVRVLASVQPGDLLLQLFWERENA
jgi:predicted deacylase